jgi:hypothetical protein
VYLAQPPLFRVDIGKETLWAADDAHLQRILAEKRGKPEIQRFKGLGEMMPETLRDTTLDPKKRQLIQVAVRDELATDRTIASLMGKDAGCALHVHHGAGRRGRRARRVSPSARSSAPSPRPPACTPRPPPAAAATPAAATLTIKTTPHATLATAYRSPRGPATSARPRRSPT